MLDWLGLEETLLAGARLRGRLKGRLKRAVRRLLDW
jgi:hypothetical protein